MDEALALKLELEAAPPATQAGEIAFMDYALSFSLPPTPAIFLDRDGVINVRPPEHQYAVRQEDIHFITGCDLALGRLWRLPYPLLVVTNQPAVGMGLVSQEQLDELHDWMLEVLWKQGVHISQVYACPHAPEDECECRKPKPGLLLRAARELHLDLPRSYMIGDSACDAEAAWAAGVGSVYLVLPDDGSDPCPPEPQGEYWVVEDLASAVDAILEREGR